MMVARRGSFGVFGHCCKSSCPGCGLATAPGRIISGVRFRGDRRQAFKPSAQIFCKNERALRVLDGTKLTGTDRLIKASPPNVGGLARLCDTVGKWRIHCNLATKARD